MLVTMILFPILLQVSPSNISSCPPRSMRRLHYSASLKLGEVMWSSLVGEMYAVIGKSVNNYLLSPSLCPSYQQNFMRLLLCPQIPRVRSRGELLKWPTEDIQHEWTRKSFVVWVTKILELFITCPSLS